MTDELPYDRELPAQMQNALGWLERETGRGYDVERGLAALEGKLGTKVAAPGRAPPPPRSVFGWKVGGVIGVGALLGIVAYTTMSNVSVSNVTVSSMTESNVTVSSARSEPRAGSTERAPSFVPPSPSVVDSPAPNVRIVPSEVTVESLPIAPPASSSTVAPARPERRKVAPASEDPVHAELAHAARLRALAVVDPSAALREAAEGDRLFARGVLGEEREAIAIGALAKLGRMQEVRARAARYLSAHPTGPLAEEVKQLAGVGSSPSPGERP